MSWKRVPFHYLKGQVLKSIEVSPYKHNIIFENCNSDTFKMYHFKDCCERVEVEDICGDLNDLIGEKITLAEEVVNHEDPDDIVNPRRFHNYRRSYTWTFYRLATRKGYVTIRWYGESNGCYSERVDFLQYIDDKDDN